jgi:HSP20 family protein
MPNLEDEFKLVINRYLRSRFCIDRIDGNIWGPPTDVYITKSEIIICLELASITPGDVEITLDGQKLTIEGFRQQPNDKAKISYQQMEIEYGRFRRVIALPFETDLAKLKTSYDRGILEIKLPISRRASAEILIVKME